MPSAIVFILKKELYAILSLLLLLLVGCTIPSEESTSLKAKKFEEYITQMFKLGEFNGNVLVAEKGEVIYQRAIGQRSVSIEDSLNLGSQFRLASASKPFTAMAIMILKEAGKLDYEDPIQKFIPEWPYKGATIRNLLNHTSGIPNRNYLFSRYWKPQLSPYDIERITEGNKQMIQLFINHKPELEFKPGKKYGYSDAGYVLLSIIVERISGIPFHQYMRENVFLPAGMENTYVFSPLRKDPLTNRAYGIITAPNGIGHKDIDFFYLDPLTGANGVYSTVEDLYRWDRILYSEKLVSSSTLKEAFTPAILNNGDTTGYGFGWSIRKNSSGGKIVAHSGYSAGFGIELIRDLNKENTIIILTNYSLYLWDGIIQNLNRILENQEYKLPERISIAKVFGPTLLNENIAIAREQYFEIKQNHSFEYEFNENELNNLGCRLLRYGYKEEALLVYQFNSEEYPESANVWHSLANCFLYLGKNENALEYFQKALEIDPDFYPSKQMLEWMKKMNWDS